MDRDTDVYMLTLSWDGTPRKRSNSDLSGRGYLDGRKIENPAGGNDLVMPSIRELWRLASTRFGRVPRGPAMTLIRGAGHYVSKYVSKQLTDWDFHAHHR